jgi:hypothetical protein
LPYPDIGITKLPVPNGYPLLIKLWMSFKTILLSQENWIIALKIFSMGASIVIFGLQMNSLMGFFPPHTLNQLISNLVDFFSPTLFLLYNLVLYPFRTIPEPIVAIPGMEYCIEHVTSVGNSMVYWLTGIAMGCSSFILNLLYNLNGESIKNIKDIEKVSLGLGWDNLSINGNFVLLGLCALVFFLTMITVYVFLSYKDKVEGKGGGNNAFPLESSPISFNFMVIKTISEKYQYMKFMYINICSFTIIAQGSIRNIFSWIFIAIFVIVSFLQGAAGIY